MTATRLPLLIACAGALVCGACLPIAHTVTDSPAIEGTYRHEDGRPVAGAPLALSVEYGDSTCTRAGLRTATDAAGNFALPAMRHRERFILLLPVDRFFTYTLCGGEAGTTPLYHDNSLHSVSDSATVTCTRLAMAEPTTGRRTHCTSSQRRRRRAARR